MSYNVREYQSLDPSAKTITVPAGGGGLIGALKGELTKNGWKQAIYRGPRVTAGTTGKDTRLEEYDTFNTRYNLLVNYNQFDKCFPAFDPAYYYDISIIDNNNGQEVMTLSGRGCEHAIVGSFRDWLTSK